MKSKKKKKEKKKKKRKRGSHSDQEHDEGGIEEDGSADLRLETAIEIKAQQLRWYLEGQLDILTETLTESEAFLEAHP
jgi:hypothetical protein